MNANDKTKKSTPEKTSKVKKIVKKVAKSTEVEKPIKTPKVAKPKKQAPIEEVMVLEDEIMNPDKATKTEKQGKVAKSEKVVKPSKPTKPTKVEKQVKDKLKIKVDPETLANARVEKAKAIRKETEVSKKKAQVRKPRLTLVILADLLKNLPITTIHKEDEDNFCIGFPRSNKKRKNVTIAELKEKAYSVLRKAGYNEQVDITTDWF